MKRNFIRQIIGIVAVLLATLPLSAYTQIFAFAKMWGGGDYGVLSYEISVDKFSNSYILGVSEAYTAVDFDPGPGVTMMGSGHYIAKYNSTGGFLWAMTMPSTAGPWNARRKSIISMKADPEGNSYVTGLFTGTIDCDPGPGVTQLTTTGTYGIYIIKISPQGSFIWGKGYSTDRPDPNTTITVHQNQVYVGGRFGLYKLDSGGNQIFYKQTGGVINSIAIDRTGNIYTTGSFQYNPDFDPGPGVVQLNGSFHNDIFICKLNASAEFQWVKQIGSGTADDDAYCIKIDQGNNLYIGGNFQSTVDFDPGTGVFNLTTPNTFQESIFLLKLNTSGNFQWVNQVFGSYYVDFYDLCIDKDANTFFVGSFSGSTTPLTFTSFNSQSKTILNTTNNTEDGFVCKTDPMGKVQSIVQISGTYEEVPRGVATDAIGDVVIVGDSKSDLVNFDYGIPYFAAKPTTVYFPNGIWQNSFLTKRTRSNFITGKCFIDLNSDNIYQSTEYPARGVIVKAKRNTLEYFTATDSLGAYRMEVDSGTFAITIADSLKYFSSTPSNHSAIFSFNYDKTDSLNNFAFKSQFPVNDLKVTLSAVTPSRPGFQTKYVIDYKNVGTNIATGNVQLQFASQLNYINSSVAPLSNTNNLITWNYTNLKPSESRKIEISFLLPSSVSLSTNLKSVATINPALGDSLPANNKDSIYQIVTGSYDPNDKSVIPNGNVNLNFITSRRYLDYNIRFQNTGSDTAFVVIVRDTLDSNLDVSSFEMVGSSHSYILSLQKNGIIEWKFNDINLVDSGRNEFLSHGYIRFKIKPKNALVAGSEVKNKSYIFFDYNTAIITNQTRNIVVANTVPITLTSFDIVNKDCGSIHLKWSTAQEINNSYFTIEKRLGGSNWIPIINIPSYGNSNVTQTYSYVDSASIGLIYYRLKQTDSDGRSSFSNIKAVNCIPGNSRPFVYPNPFNIGSNLTIDFPGKYSYRIFDVNGRLLYYNLEANNKLILQLDDILSGFYLLQIISGQAIYNHKLIVK